ncbi:HRDC domain-containing protein [Propionibacterium australiense]|uniref:3'-5' exonuclease domain n=1 Tax=Propionibacterium australiense TaxID=119981 RepID=A0A383S8V5_9ACTN|nr:HRDC domain-containing protein [Propionibacterium australiense]RLP06885.1 ribonuclease D [Propionibacterium australiense]RLP08844.1 ribonuclease D [Propionibacterium australiense]SYZ34347.1 3'-5' exonuclease domain [Propionibacterium australiense]VEH90060.1 Ribonuclease D [Propionibacterium australiense]
MKDTDGAQHATTERDGLIDPDSGLPVLAVPGEGLPPLVDTAEKLAECVQVLGAGTGPVAIDTERAQSFRYSGRAYLLQIRRHGCGTWLIDPQAFEPGDGSVADLSTLREAITDSEWVIHAANSDLPCLSELGLLPERLFDTELAGRLLGMPRVGLGPMAETFFGVHLLKEHSVADWSKRPLPADWIAYAALDVELLVELRDLLWRQLHEQGKWGWAQQEFQHMIDAHREPPTPPAEPWRHVNGLHSVRTRRGLALVREIWTERDRVARELDRAPGKILPDKAISELASQITKNTPDVPGMAQMNAVMGFKRRNARRYRGRWLAAAGRIAAMSESELPRLRVPHEGPSPQPRNWQRTNPDAWRRWQRVRPAMNRLAKALDVPPENLIAPETLRRLAWEPLETVDREHVAARLAAHGARGWQCRLTAPVIVAALGSTPR